MKNTRRNDVKKKTLNQKNGGGTGDRLPGRLPLEDMVLKNAVQCFGDVLLPFLGIPHKVVAVTSTEQVYLEARRVLEDYNFETEDGSWIHLEFESDSVKDDDLRRFRSYEALMGHVYRIPVTTYVICSSTVKSIKNELTEGINTYRVEIIRLKDWNADLLFEELQRKRSRGEPLQKKDLAPVLAAPLMTGTMTLGDRFVKGNELLQEADEITEKDLWNMQSVLYALANKFLDDTDLNQVKEALFMTRLGEMLWKDGVEQGILQGLEQGLEQGVEQGMEQGLESGMKQGMERGLENGIKQGLKQGLDQGVCATLSILREMEFSYSAAQKKLMEKFSLSEKHAGTYMKKYWNGSSRG